VCGRMGAAVMYRCGVCGFLCVGAWVQL
jgi:hypothetical protein